MSFSPEERSICRLVGTPIGNLGDLSPRATAALSEADVVFAEDTRTAKALLHHLGISKPLKSYHKDNEKDAASAVLKEMEKGNKVALISEAGMPGISDPGFILINELLNKNIPHEIIPGASASVHAAVASGLCSDGRFIFYGFLPQNGMERTLEKLSALPFPIVFYEAPHRIKRTLGALLEHFAPPLAVSRELTKLHEETLFIQNTSDIDNLTAKGEFCIVAKPAAKHDETTINILPEKIAELLINYGMTAKDTAGILKSLGVKRNTAYGLADQSAEKNADSI